MQELAHAAVKHHNIALEMVPSASWPAVNAGNKITGNQQRRVVTNTTPTPVVALYIKRGCPRGKARVPAVDRSFKRRACFLASLKIIQYRMGTATIITVVYTWAMILAPVELVVVNVPVTSDTTHESLISSTVFLSVIQTTYLYGKYMATNRSNVTVNKPFNEAVNKQ